MFAISAATEKDIPQLLRVINSAYRGEVSRKGWTTEADFLEGELRTDAEDLADLMTRKEAVILKVGTANGDIAGCVFLEKRADRLYLGMLSVSPDQQGMGIGKILLRGAEEHARAAGCRAIFMQVIYLREELIAWYERHGYHNTGERRPFDAPLKFGIPRRPLEFTILEKAV